MINVLVDFLTMSKVMLSILFVNMNKVDSKE